MAGCATEKWLLYGNKYGKKDKTGGKFALIRQETQAEEVAARYNKTRIKNEKKKSITVNENVNWCTQDKSITRKIQ